MVNKCKKCGRTITKNDIFCPYCGEQQIHFEKNNIREKSYEEILNDEIKSNEINKKKVKKIIIIAVVVCVFITILLSTLLPLFLKTEHEISFDSNGGSSCSTIYSHGNEVIKLPVPTREGYLFDGWYTQPNRGGTWVNSTTYQSKTLDQNLKLYAGWSYYKTINFNGNTTTSEEYLFTVTTQHNYDSVLKMTTIYATLYVGYYVLGESTVHHDAIKDVSLSTTVAGKSVYFNKANQVVTFTTSTKYYAWDHINVGMISGTFKALVEE